MIPLPPPRLIVLGASAGGVETLRTILTQLPDRYPIPIAAVLHRGADSEGLVERAFGHDLKIPCKDAEDKEPILPSHCYFAPADYHLLVDLEGRFSLSVEEPVNFSRPSIDLLLTSAANTYRESLLAIVLTGANQDGARGLAHALMRGAQTIVQDPRTAVQAMMPQEALRAAQQAFKEPGTPAGSAGEKPRVLAPVRQLSPGEIGGFLVGLATLVC